MKYLYDLRMILYEQILKDVDGKHLQMWLEVSRPIWKLARSSFKERKLTQV